MDGLDILGTAFGTYSTTLFVGTPIEIVSVTAQQAVNIKEPEKPAKPSYYIPSVDNVTFPGRKDYGEYGLLYNWHSGYAKR